MYHQLSDMVTSVGKEDVYLLKYFSFTRYLVRVNSMVKCYLSVCHSQIYEITFLCMSSKYQVVFSKTTFICIYTFCVFTVQSECTLIKLTFSRFINMGLNHLAMNFLKILLCAANGVYYEIHDKI